MIAVIQRVSQAEVAINGTTISHIDHGLLVLLGVEKKDNEAQASRLAERVMGYRIFNDLDDKMNLNVQQVGGSILVVSQFTLVADTKNGMRPSFSQGAVGDRAEYLYQCFIQHCKTKGITTKSGQFSANMQVSLTNDGPATFWLQL